MLATRTAAVNAGTVEYRLEPGKRPPFIVFPGDTCLAGVQAGLGAACGSAGRPWPPVLMTSQEESTERRFGSPFAPRP